MPRSHPTRTAEPVSYADSNSGDTEPDETPKKASTSKVKRRVSGYVPELGPNESLVSASRSVRSLNDDAAEKRLRRKSTKVLDSGNISGEDANETRRTPTKKASGAKDGPRTPRMTALARANQLKAVDHTPMPAESLEVMSSNFEEWMKMATDNKINASNSWSFALIDYFHDMSLLRNETDNSINFQKASRTLDGCVKIWTSRVDSVGTDTGKLLSNLANEGGRAGEDGGEDAEDEPDQDGEPNQSKKKKAHRPEATLAKNIAQLRTKKLDLEFTVDPLFKKTCADFDEGGAQGLLMNHLGVDGNIRVVFDAGDSGNRDEDEEENVSGPVDLSQLRAKVSLPTLEDKTISSSRLPEFKFLSDPSVAGATSGEGTYREGSRVDGADLDSDDEADFQPNNDAEPDFVPADDDRGAAQEDFFTGDQAVNEDFGGADDFAPDDYPQERPDQATHLGPDGTSPFDPRRIPNERDLVLSMTEEGESMMDYFDSSVIKSWAGPEHWKLRKVVRKPDVSTDTVPKQKKEKQAFQIEFSEPFEMTAKELFAPSTRGGLTLPSKSGAFAAHQRNKKAASEKREDSTLPDDMHFSSRQLLTLFMKPKFSLKTRNQRRIEVQHGEVDDQFWAQAAAGQNDGVPGADGEQLPFNTQFLNDDYDDGHGFDDAYDGAGAGDPGVAEDEDLLAATQGQLKRARPEFVNYTKRVKRIDVRKLKENIWKGLDIVVPPTETEEEAPSAEHREPTAPEEPREFTSVIQKLRTQYPQEKMKDISTSFCFICLLHLANERGLKIEADEDTIKPKHDEMEEQEETEKVGDIWSLKIYRDPNAIPSA